MITAEAQLTNAIAALRQELQRQPPSAQKARLDTLLRQLEAQWQAYQAGTLAPRLDTGDEGQPTPR